MLQASKRGNGDNQELKHVECGVPVLQNGSDIIVTERDELAPSVIEQAKALTTIADSLSQIANFLSGGGLTKVLSGYARTQMVKEILGGLACHDGRGSLDARVMEQNATEIVHHVEAVFAKFDEKLSAPKEDPELHDSESQYNDWLAKKIADKMNTPKG